MIKKVYNYSSGEEDAVTVTLGDLLPLLGSSRITHQWVKLIVSHPSKDGSDIGSTKVYEGDVAEEAFIKSINKFMNCPVRNVASEVENGKPLIRVIVRCDKYVPFDLDEHIDEFADDFLTNYN